MTDGIEQPVAPCGTEANIAEQHRCGKLTAAERIEFLLDPGSFEACDASSDPAAEQASRDSVVTGRGTINGRTVFVYAKDITVLAGSLSHAEARKIGALHDLALADGAPLIGIFDSLGIRLQDGLVALAGLGDIFQRSALASGVILRIAAIMGPCIGGDAFIAGASDFTFMVRDTGALFVSGPDVIEALTGERIRAEELGGAAVHSVESGIADVVYDNDVEALLQMRRLIDFLPSSSGAAVPRWPSFDDPERIEMSLDSLVPDDPTKPYDIRELIFKTVDEGDFFEIQQAHAQNIIIGFGRIDGGTIGLVANQPLTLAGVLDGDALGKATRFIRFCARFNIPIVAFVDAPGFLPGAAQEHGGLARRGPELFVAYAQAHVPKITIVVRSAFGAAYVMMGSKAMGADRVYAWPTADIGLTRLPVAGELRGALAHGLIDAIIEPHATRLHIVGALRRSRDAREQKRQDARQ